MYASRIRGFAYLFKIKKIALSFPSLSIVPCVQVTKGYHGALGAGWEANGFVQIHFKSASTEHPGAFAAGDVCSAPADATCLFAGPRTLIDSLEYHHVLCEAKG